MKHNLENYKATIEAMAEKKTFRLAEFHPRRFDLFYVLKKYNYIQQIDYGVYKWAGKKPNIRTAKRVALLTQEYRRSWTSSQNKEQTSLELKTERKTQNATEKQINKEKAGAITTMILVGVVVLATIINFIIYLNN